ncbi:glyoxylase-like metal-dependent hydrolase (beta-lactamase superfamily II) [Streptomyces canus]|uniref:Glyoxylase-like metal-dependent hydrolase (Beta-lactamase superfamily II) n=1 Tax=Streptomyces canus TaxID=58343 RepID=A0AAW8F598_9ACTN|nr:MBL fold metallo-hydrolase [Streptomyces canus]MDQ0904994.1 glyoxylase-like metal-dependent hydrolase (beta-lactamase superfamily II) [Streptomyces canus]
MTAEPMGSGTSRRTLLKRASVAAAVPTVASLLGGFPGTAAAGDVPRLPDYAPIPATSVGPAMNADGYFVGQIKGNLYWVTDTYYQAMFLTTREGVVLVDAPPTLGHNLLRAIQEVTRANGKPSRVTHLVYSHSHADHIGAASLFGKHVVRIGHTETRRLLRIDADPNRPAPTVTFDDRYVLRVGGERLELAYHGPNHSPDNIFVYAPDYATLMVVDVLFPGWAPFKGLAASQDIPAWIKAHDTAMNYPWRTLVGGHLGRLGVRADATIQREYVTDLLASTRAAEASVDPTPFYEKYGPTGNSWAIFKTYLDAVATTAAAPVVAKYTGVLAAADVFTVDNAMVMLESLRIDFGELGPFGIRP